MNKTILHKLFGFGKIPKRYAPILSDEGIILADEGISGSVTLRNFRAPGRIHSWKKNWFTGSLVITEKTFAAFALFKPIIYVPLVHDQFSELHITLKNDNIFFIKFDASVFNDKASGIVECQFKTSKASLFVERLKPKA